MLERSTMNTILKLGLLLFLAGSLQGSPTVRKKGYGPGEQEWGHIDVRKGAHMFYWLFYVQDPKVTSFYDRPLVVWLQGGPGESSSGFGNFEEIGPLFVNGTARPSSWAKHVNLLFVDSPVGAGFSYVDNIAQLPKTNIEIGKDMVTFLTAFYKQFPKFEKTPFYIYSESYGGKMTVEISKQLWKAIENKKINMNFKGIGLGNPNIVPFRAVSIWGSFLFVMGVMDVWEASRLHPIVHKIENALEKGEFEEATILLENYQLRLLNETGNVDFLNIMKKVRPLYKFDENKRLESYISPRFDYLKLQKLMEGPVKKAMGISSKIVYNSQSGEVYKALRGDFMKPVHDVFEELLDTTSLEVVMYLGNLDLTVSIWGTTIWLENMDWKNSTDEWRYTPQKPVVLNGYIEGYVKKAGNFYLYTVLRAGQMVPTDNPHTALEILRRSTGYDKVKVDSNDESAE